MMLTARPAPAADQYRTAGVATVQWRAVTSAVAVLAAGTLSLFA